MDQQLRDILESYGFLIPPRDEGLVIYWLNDKINKKEIDRNFTYQDIQRAITEVSSWEQTGHQPFTERIVKNLLHFFLERPTDRRDRYKLSSYAANFLKLLENKLNNPYRYFPLRESFKRYAVFKAEHIATIQHFESWYYQGFDATTKQTTLDHLEALKDEIESSIAELHGILHTTELQVRETVNRFSSVFKGFGDKSEEIKDALKLETNLETEINKVVQSFYLKIEIAKHPENTEEEIAHEKIRRDYLRSAEIQRQVKQFFEIVDEKLGQLNSRIIFSSTKLTELQDNFKYQTKFKFNIRRFLKFTLENARHTRDGIELDERFPLKSVPAESFRFIAVPDYKFFVTNQNKVIKPKEDNAYLEKEKAGIERELTRQENTVKLFKKYKDLLRKQGELDFTFHFYDIIKTEQDEETALQVGFELFQFASKSSNKYLIRVDKQLTKEFNNNEIAIWKMKIRKRNS